MIENLGRLSRTVRIFVAVAALILAYFESSLLLAVVGLLLLVTSMFAWCPFVWVIARKNDKIN